VKICLTIWGLPWQRVWYVRGLPWKLVWHFGSRNYSKSDLLRLWITRYKDILILKSMMACNMPLLLQDLNEYFGTTRCCMPSYTSKLLGTWTVLFIQIPVDVIALLVRCHHITREMSSHYSLQRHFDFASHYSWDVITLLVKCHHITREMSSHYSLQRHFDFASHYSWDVITLLVMTLVKCHHITREMSSHYSWNVITLLVTKTFWFWHVWWHVTCRCSCRIWMNHTVYVTSNGAVVKL